MTGFRLTSLISLIRGRTGRLAAHVLLLLFALRAVVPVGYMPDLGALRDGQVQIVICTGAGTQALFVDQSGHPVEAPDQSGHAAAGDCAFATATAAVFALPASMTLVGKPPFAGGLEPSTDMAVPTPPSQGPPLGSRAPPIFLG